MVLGNLNNLSVIVFLSFLFIGGLILLLLFNKEKYKVLFLFFSFLFLIINIFEIKGGYNNKLENIEGGKIVFILDVSKSMNAFDIDYYDIKKSRIDTSKFFIDNYINNTNNSYGLMVFAGEALEMLPFTTDIGIFKTVLYGLNNDNVSKFGINLNSVFESLQNYFSTDNDGGLAVIFTDGGDENISVSEDLLDSLDKKGVKILIVGVGTTDGTRIPTGKDFFGRIIYKKYNGEYVVTKLNKKVLKNITSKYDIGYINISDEDDFEKVSDYISSNINKINIKKNINYRVDYTRFFIFLSFLFFIIYLFSINLLGRKI